MVVDAPTQDTMPGGGLPDGAMNMLDAYWKDLLSPMEGEKNPSAKLSNDEVDEIRRLLRETDLPQVEIGDSFNVSQALVSLIKRGKR